MSEPSTVHEALRASAKVRPDGLAYGVAGASITFAELEARVARVASGLARHGVGAGDRVAIGTGTRLETLLLVHASHWIGAIPTVVDATLDARRIARRVAAAECRVLIMDRAPAGLDGIAAVVEPGELEASASGGSAPSPPSPDQPAFLQFTSGTTGKPWAAIISHRAAMAYLTGRAESLQIRPDDVLVTWVPLHHDLGLVMFGLGAVVFRVPVHLLPPELRRLREWLLEIGRVGATITASPDFGYRTAARLVDPTGVDLSSLRFAVNGGEPPRLSTIEAFEARFSVPGVIRPGYGLAEATLGATSYLPNEPIRVDAAGRVSSGRALNAMRILVVDDAGQPLPAGEIGSIRLSGPQLFRGYYRDSLATREVLVDGWLRTGDVGYLDPDGHLFVLARERAMIKRAGASIAPVELEEAVDQLEAVRRSAAFGVSDGEKQLIVVAEVAVSAQTDGLERAIAERVLRVVGGPPDEILIVAPHSIPLSRSGKTRYEELRRLWADRTLGGSTQAASLET